jgi:hypothetical protein
MNAVEYTQNAESKFNLTQVKASVFLQPLGGKEDKDSIDRMQFLQSIKKIPANNLSTSFDPLIESKFQEKLESSLNTAVNQEFDAATKLLDKEGTAEFITSRFKFVNIHPKKEYGSLEQVLFKKFMTESVQEFEPQSIDKLYNDFIKADDNLERSDAVKFVPFLQAALDIESQAQGGQANDSKYFSLRNFLFTMLFNSPLTVKEKLDVIYDIVDISNKYADGLDM